jgi:hypothetical protein
MTSAPMAPMTTGTAVFATTQHASPHTAATPISAHASAST